MPKMFQHKIYIARPVQNVPVIEWDHPNKTGDRTMSQNEIDAGYTTFTLRFKEYIDRSVENSRQVFVVVENGTAVYVNWTQPTIKNHQSLHRVSMLIPSYVDNKKREPNISRAVENIANNYPFISARLVNDLAHTQTKIERTRNNIAHLEEKLTTLNQQLRELQRDNEHLLELAEEETVQGPPRISSSRLPRSRETPDEEFSGESPSTRPARAAGSRDVGQLVPRNTPRISSHTAQQPRAAQHTARAPPRNTSHDHPTSKSATKSGAKSSTSKTTKPVAQTSRVPPPPGQQIPMTLEFITNTKPATSTETASLIKRLTTSTSCNDECVDASADHVDTSVDHTDGLVSEQPTDTLEPETDVVNEDTNEEEVECTNTTQDNTAQTENEPKDKFDCGTCEDDGAVPESSDANETVQEQTPAVNKNWADIEDDN